MFSIPKLAVLNRAVFSANVALLHHNRLKKMRASSISTLACFVCKKVFGAIKQAQSKYHILIRWEDTPQIRTTTQALEGLGRREHNKTCERRD
jgi:hypothetical protein